MKPGSNGSQPSSKSRVFISFLQVIFVLSRETLAPFTGNQRHLLTHSKTVAVQDKMDSFVHYLGHRDTYIAATAFT